MIKPVTMQKSERNNIIPSPKIGMRRRATAQEHCTTLNVYWHQTPAFLNRPTANQIQRIIQRSRLHYEKEREGMKFQTFKKRPLLLDESARAREVNAAKRHLQCYSSGFPKISNFIENGHEKVKTIRGNEEKEIIDVIIQANVNNECWKFIVTMRKKLEAHNFNPMDD